MLILLLIYFGIIALWRSIDDQTKAAKAVAIVTLVGSLILPVIKFSVDWFYTLHQPASVLTMEGPKIHPSMLTPLLIMGLGFLMLHITLLMMLMRAELMERRARRLAISAVSEADDDLCQWIHRGGLHHRRRHSGGDDGLCHASAAQCPAPARSG